MILDEQNQAKKRKEKDTEDKKKADQEYTEQSKFLDASISKMNAEDEKLEESIKKLNKEKKEGLKTIESLEQKIKQAKSQNELDHFKQDLIKANNDEMKKKIEAAMMIEKHDHLMSKVKLKESQEKAIMVQKIANDQVLRDSSREFEEKLAHKMNLMKVVNSIKDEQKRHKKVKETNQGAIKIDREMAEELDL